MQRIPFYLLLLTLSAITLASRAVAEPRLVFLVRHAERADVGKTPESDPDLSEKGRARAQALAHELSDAGITAIFTTEYKRTQETAAPLAHSLGLRDTVVPAKATADLIAQIKSSSGNVLVMGHSNTLPEIARGLGATSAVKIGETTYDDLFLLLMAETPAQLIHLHYR